MAKDSFIFYRSFYEAMQALSDKDRLKVYDAIAEKALNNNDVQLTGLANSMFTLIKPQIEANNKKYENGKKGGRPKNKNQNETTGFENDTKNKNQNETETKANENEECRMNNEECKMKNENAECKMIMQCYEDNIGLFTPAVAELLLSNLDDITAEMIVEAIKISSQRNKKDAKYIQGILNNWINKGYKTLGDIKQEQKNNENIIDEVWNDE